MASRTAIPAITLCALLAGGAGLCRAESRMALVIGNSAYDPGKLGLPVKDAGDLASVLRELRFDVTLELDLARHEMEVALDAFAQSLRPGVVGLFYFAGHSLQLAGKNYLVPVDADTSSAEDTKKSALPLLRVLNAMSAAKSDLAIIVLDAAHGGAVRETWGGTPGLAPVEPRANMCVALSAMPGSAIVEADGRNSVYMAHLMRTLRKSGLAPTAVFEAVRAAVERETNGNQIPFAKTSFTGAFFFVRSPPPSAPAVRQSAAFDVRRRHVFPNGAVYEGEWADEQRNGQGTLLLPNGARYEGNWSNDMENGAGLYTWPSGSRYEGTFRNGKQHGKGTVTWANGTRYEGQFLGGRYHGYGVFKDADCVTYKGGFVKGRRHGRGTLARPDGSTYIGQFMNGYKHGYGVYSWSSGDRHEGQFRNGVRHGRGCYTYANGKAIEGYWENDKPVRYR